MVRIDESLCVSCGSCARACPMGVIQYKDGKPGILPGRRCIQCMHCVSICPKRAVIFDGIEYQIRESPETEIERLVMSRRSVRHFKADPPPKEIIQWALDTAAYAPSGKNAHDTRWTVLYGLEETEKVTNMALDYCVKHKDEAPELIYLHLKGVNLITCNAPCVIVGWSPDDALNPVVDTAVAAATVELLLQSRGLSTCWGGYLRQITNVSEELNHELGIPVGCNMRTALLVGYADKEKYLHIPYRPAAQVEWVENG